MLRKKEVFTIITPIPGFIPRQLAIDILHSHSEVITLNPLVLDHKPIKAPRDAASDEYYSTWYEITERIQYIPGMGKLGSGKISFNGCFHDMPWGLQTHIYAPMNVDLRNKYRIAGNQPGVEPPETPEIGLAELGAPSDGLYLREDIEIKCNVTIVNFVKSQLKQASKEMVQRIIKKAELLDAGVLQGMLEGGKLKTINPADRSNTVRSSRSSYQSASSPQPSPTTPHYSTQGTPPIPYTVPRPQSAHPSIAGPSGAQQGYIRPQELPTEVPPQQGVIMELPGDFYHPQVSPRLQPPPAVGGGSLASGSPRESLASSATSLPGGCASSGRWSSSDFNNSSRPTSLQSDGSGGGLRSPPLDHKGFSSDLATHAETLEEGQHRDDALRTLDAGRQQLQQQPPQQKGYTYNPADYAKVSPQMQQVSKMDGGYPYGHGQHLQYQQQQQRYGNHPNNTFYTH